MARADFSGSGYEEILVHEYVWAIGETMGFGGIKILGRNRDEGPLELVAVNRYSELGANQGLLLGASP